MAGTNFDTIHSNNAIFNELVVVVSKKNNEKTMTLSLDNLLTDVTYYH